MAPESLTIRFQSTGAWEYVTTERVPEVGDTLVRDGETWTVSFVAESVDDHRVIIMAPAPQEVVLPLVKARRGSWTRNLNAAPFGT